MTPLQNNNSIDGHPQPPSLQWDLALHTGYGISDAARDKTRCYLSLDKPLVHGWHGQYFMQFVPASDRPAAH